MGHHCLLLIRGLFWSLRPPELEYCTLSCYKFAVVPFPVSTGVSVFAKVTRQVIKVPLCGEAANKAATVDLLKVLKMRRSTQKSFTVPVCSLPSQVFKPRTPPEAIALCSRLLEYTPVTRLSPLEACAHAFFEELRQPNTRLPSGRELPLLFNFSPVGQFSCFPAFGH